MTVKLPINYLDTGKVARDKINNSFNEMVATVQWYRPHIEGWIWYIWTTNTWVKAVWDSIEMKVEDWYILYKSESQTNWTQIIAVADLKWDKGDKWDPFTYDDFTEEQLVALTWPQWPRGEKWNKWDKWDTGEKWDKGDTGEKWDKGDTGETWPQWPQWDKGDKGEKWEQGVQGIQWPTWDAFAVYKTYPSIASMNADKNNVPEWKFVMIVSTVEDPDNAKLYVKWASDFTFLTDMSGATGMKWDTWEQGVQGEQWEKGDTGASITSAAFSWDNIVFGKDDQTSVTLVNAKTELKWEKGDKWDKWDKGDQWPAWPWSWDVIWPNSAWDENIALYDWTTWKLIKDSWLKVSDIKWNWVEVNVATAYWTAAKVWTTTAGDYTPTKWDFLLVNFVNGCSVDNPTLNIDWSGAKAIRTGSANATKSTFALWTTANSNIKALFYYDWTYYRCWSTTNSNTTYSAMSVAEWQTGTATSSRSMTAANLKSIIKYHAVNNSRLSDDWYTGSAIAPSQASIYYEFAKRDIQAWTDLEIVWISSHNLPEWYTELSFLWWSGSWYINMWNIVQCKDTVKIRFKRPTATTPSSTQSFFGSIQGSSSVPRYNIWFRSNWYVFWWANQTVDFAPIDTNIHTVEQWYDWVDYYYKYDNWAKTTYTPTSTTDPSINAYLFARNWSTVIYSWWVRIYYVEWHREDWTEVAHLIPAQRDDDWVLWMYDLVSETFLAPAGSGTRSWEPLGNVINFTNDSGFITSAALPTKTSDLTNDSWFITSSALPTKTSDLTNDSWFITSAALPTKTSDLTNDSWFITSSALPTKTSDLTNDSGFITSSYHDSTKQNTLSTQTAYTSKGSATKVPQITTNTLWQVTWITEVTITQPDISWKQDKATSWSTAPSTTPSYIWQQFVDTTNDKLYVATGTSSSSDWVEVWSGWGGIQNDTTWTTSTIEAEWVWTDIEFNALSSYWNKIYNIIE